MGMDKGPAEGSVPHSIVAPHRTIIIIIIIILFPRSLDEGLINKEQSYRWLKFGDIKGETESAIMAAQDQSISTNYFKKNILKQEIESNADCVNNTKRQLTRMSHSGKE
jgi:hypothetical protein